MNNLHHMAEDELALYNPAYLGFLLYTTIREYNKASSTPFSSNLAFVVLPLTVNHLFSRRLPSRKNASIDKWVNDVGGLLYQFPELVKSYRGSVVDAIEFLVELGLVDIGAQGEFMLKGKKLPSKPSLFKRSTDMESTLGVATFLGRWLANNGSDVVIYSKLGVTP